MHTCQRKVNGHRRMIAPLLLAGVLSSFMFLLVFVMIHDDADVVTSNQVAELDVSFIDAQLVRNPLASGNCIDVDELQVTILQFVQPEPSFDGYIVQADHLQGSCGMSDHPWIGDMWVEQYRFTLQDETFHLGGRYVDAGVAQPGLDGLAMKRSR